MGASLLPREPQEGEAKSRFCGQRIRSLGEPLAFLFFRSLSSGWPLPYSASLLQACHSPTSRIWNLGPHTKLLAPPPLVEVKTKHCPRNLSILEADANLFLFCFQFLFFTAWSYCLPLPITRWMVLMTCTITVALSFPPDPEADPQAGGISLLVI